MVEVSQIVSPVAWLECSGFESDWHLEVQNVVGKHSPEVFLVRHLGSVEDYRAVANDNDARSPKRVQAL